MKKTIILLFLFAFVGGASFANAMHEKQGSTQKKHKHHKHHRHHRHPHLPPHPALPPHP